MIDKIMPIMTETDNRDLNRSCSFSDSFINASQRLTVKTITETNMPKDLKTPTELDQSVLAAANMKKGAKGQNAFQSNVLPRSPCKARPIKAKVPAMANSGAKPLVDKPNIGPVKSRRLSPPRDSLCDKLPMIVLIFFPVQNNIHPRKSFNEIAALLCQCEQVVLPLLKIIFNNN